MKIPNDTIIVVASGQEAKLFRTGKDADHPTLEHVEDLAPQNLVDDGPAGKRPPESSDKETDEATFAKQLAHELNERAKRGKFERVIVVADPTTLGEMRPLYHDELSKRVVEEIAKTLINSPTEDILGTLKDA